MCAAIGRGLHPGQFQRKTIAWVHFGTDIPTKHRKIFSKVFAACPAAGQFEPDEQRRGAMSSSAVVRVPVNFVLYTFGKIFGKIVQQNIPRLSKL